MKKETKERIIGILAAILIMIIALMIGVEVTINYQEKWEKECNNKFGKGNWTLKDITGTGKYRFYIGQVWECVEK